MLVLRQSDLKQWMTDRRDFYFGVFENLEPVQQRFSETATIGTFVHEGMKAHYRQSKTSPIAAIGKAAKEEIKKSPILQNEFIAAADFARIIFEGYQEWLAEEAMDQGFKTLQVEERITMLIGTFYDIEVYVSGQVDLVMQDYDDLIWILDHKTVDKFTTIMATLPVDFQGQTYDALLRSVGIEAVGFKHNQLKRVKRTTRAVPPFYNRESVTFNEQQRKTHMWHLQGIAAEIAGRFVTMEKLDPLSEEFQMAFHFYFQPHFTRDSTWMSRFLDVSIYMDTDPAIGYSMLQSSYQQKAKVA